MLKVYGSEMCPDCIDCKFNLDRNNIEYENKDITKLTDDGKLTLDWESFFTEQGIEVVHPGNEGAVCGIDGKGC